MLVDTNVSMNTGNTSYHQCVISQCPRLGAEYLECGADTEHDVVQLFPALDFKGSYQPIDYGDMTAAIWYLTAYLITNTSPLILSFVWGNDFALCSVLGAPCNLVMGDVVDLVIGQLVYSKLDQVFMLQLDPLCKGLPDVVTYDTSFATMPDGTHSNVLSLSSPVQYIASDGTITQVS